VRLAEGKPLGHLRLRTPGRIALTAVVALGTTGGDSVTSAIVQLGLFVDGHQVARAAREVRKGDELNIPMQGVGEGLAGVNSVGFSADARYAGEGQGGDLVESVSIIATALPPK
jgi:hypothetical protein